MLKPFGKKELPVELQKSFIRGLKAGTAQVYSEKPCIVVDTDLPGAITRSADRQLKKEKYLRKIRNALKL